MIRIILLILFVLVVLAFTFLKWWQILIVGAVLIVLSKFLAKRLILWLVSTPFRAKGKVLRAAAVEVHSVRPAAAPIKAKSDGQQRLTDESEEGDEADDEDADEPDISRDYYEIDVTISPGATTGPFQYWDFNEVTLVKPGKRWNESDDTCRVEKCDLVREGTVLLNAGEKADGDDDDDGTKVMGPHRLKMLVGVPPGVRELSFNYYFENFGRLKID